MKVLHIFDRWLNQTMNWAYHSIRHNGVENHIAATTFVQNPFEEKGLYFAKSRIQKLLPTGTDEWHVSPWQKGYARVAHGGWQTFLLRYVEEKGIDLVHCHFANVAVQNKSFLEKVRVPWVVSFYGYDYEKVPFLNPEMISKYQWLFNHAAGVIVEGPHGRHILEKQGCPKEIIHVVPLGIELSKEWKGPEKNREELRLVQAATFTPKKGQLLAIEAFKRVDLDHASLTLIGEEDDREYSRKIRDAAQSHPKIFIKDFVPVEDFEEELSQYHVMIQPSRYSKDRDCEGGAPIGLLHAQWVGLPIIATIHCDIPFVVKDGTTGELTPEDDLDGLVRSMRRYYEMESKDFQNHVDACQKWVQQGFDIRLTGQKLHDLYSSLST